MCLSALLCFVYSLCCRLHSSTFSPSRACIPGAYENFRYAPINKSFKLSTRIYLRCVFVSFGVSFLRFPKRKWTTGMCVRDREKEIAARCKQWNGEEGAQLYWAPESAVLLSGMSSWQCNCCVCVCVSMCLVCVCVPLCMLVYLFMWVCYTCLCNVTVCVYHRLGCLCGRQLSYLRKCSNWGV